MGATGRLDVAGWELEDGWLEKGDCGLNVADGNLEGVDRGLGVAGGG